MLYSVDKQGTAEAEMAAAISTAARTRMAQMLDSAAYEQQDRRGGQLVVAKVHLDDHRPSHLEILRIDSIGEVPNGDTQKYTTYALEKMFRLLYGTAIFNHVYSRQSADEKKGQYPGAIYVANNGVHYFVSFSGLEAMDDEVLAIASSIDAGAMTKTALQKIEGLLPNDRWPLYFPDLAA